MNPDIIRFDLIKTSFPTESEIDLNIIRLLHHIENGTRLFELDRETGIPHELGFVPPPDRFAREIIINDEKVKYEPIGIPGLLPRQIRYFFGAYPDQGKTLPERKLDDFRFLDEFKNFIILSKLEKKEVFDKASNGVWKSLKVKGKQEKEMRLVGILTKGELNKHLTDLMDRGIVKRCATKSCQQYFLAPHSFSNRTNLPYFKDVVAKSDGNKVRSRASYSLLYQFPRNGPHLNKKSKFFKGLSIERMESRLNEEILQFRNRILQIYIDELKMPDESIYDLNKRLHLTYYDEMPNVPFFDDVDVGKALPIIILDPMIGRKASKSWL